MTPDEQRQLAARARAEIDRIESAHTADNLERLQSAFASLGWKLTGTMRRKSAFSLRGPDGLKVSGITLVEAGDMLEKISGH